MRRLKKITKEAVLNSSLWKPPDKCLDITRSTNSWFDITQMYQNQEEKTKVVNTSNIRSYPIHLRPTMKQRHILLTWNEVYRRVYNITVSYLKVNKCPSFPKLRKIIDEKIELNKNLEALSIKCNIPKHTRDNAIKDCIKAYKTAFANLKAKNIKHFKIRYKKKKHHLSSIVLEPNSFSKKKNAFAVKTLGEMKSDIEFKGISKECRLCYNNRTKQFVLRVPYDKMISKTRAVDKVASLDPGENVFQTVYTPSNNCYKICSRNTNTQISDLIERIENIKEGKAHKKYENRLREKLANKIKDLHYKSCDFLCKNFDVILVGNLSTKAITSKDKNLPKKVKKSILALSHFAFRQRLISKAEEYDSTVEVVDESYTSKTCGGCGEINEKLGAKRSFSCDNCPFKCDRDISAARNILIKYLN
jgi:IS605 OrfB family transposase